MSAAMTTTDARTPANFSRLERLAKSISDLNALLDALARERLATGLVGQTIAQQISDAATRMQVLRMTVVMDRPASEVEAAADQLAATLGRVAAYVGKVRCPATTLAACRLAASLSLAIRQDMSS